MCDSLQICLVGAVSTNILTPYGVKTAFAGKTGKYCVKFLRNLQIKGGKRLLLFVGCCKIGILQHPLTVFFHTAISTPDGVGKDKPPDPFRIDSGAGLSQNGGQPGVSGQLHGEALRRLGHRSLGKGEELPHRTAASANQNLSCLGSVIDQHRH